MRAIAGAIVHLHSTHSVAVSCLADVNPADVLPPITAYYVMKIGTLPLIPYYRPGNKKLAEAVRAVAHKHHAVLLANHGPVVAGSSLSAAGAAVEELEEIARLHLLLHGHPTRILTPEQITNCARHFLPDFAESYESTSLAWSTSGRRFRDRWLRTPPPRADPFNEWKRNSGRRLWGSLERYRGALCFRGGVF